MIVGMQTKPIRYHFTFVLFIKFKTKQTSVGGVWKKEGEVNMDSCHRHHIAPPQNHKDIHHTTIWLSKIYKRVEIRTLERWHSLSGGKQQNIHCIQEISTSQYGVLKCGWHICGMCQSWKRRKSCRPLHDLCTAEFFHSFFDWTWSMWSVLFFKPWQEDINVERTQPGCEMPLVGSLEVKELKRKRMELQRHVNVVWWTLLISG